MTLNREDYVEPSCVLCGKPGEEEPVKSVPLSRVMEKLAEYEDGYDLDKVEIKDGYDLDRMMNRVYRDDNDTAEDTTDDVTCPAAIYFRQKAAE